MGLQTLQEAIDTTTSGGKLIFQVFGALAEFERDIIREWTVAGLARRIALDGLWEVLFRDATSVLFRRKSLGPNPELVRVSRAP